MKLYADYRKLLQCFEVLVINKIAVLHKGMYMQLKQTPRYDQTLRVSARQIALSTMLHCSADELEQTIAQEQMENPVLEVLERQVCLYCGAFIQWMPCAVCGNSRLTGDVSFSSSDNSFQNEHSTERVWDQWNETQLYDGNSSYRQENDEDEEFDGLARISVDRSLSEILLQQLMMVIEPEDTFIAEQLVGNLNERGYLEIDLEEIATLLHVSLERVESVLQQLHDLEPAGIGALNLRECLLLQLSALQEQEEVPELALLLVDCYLEQIGKGQFKEVIHKLKVSEQDIQQTIRYIRHKLHPYPAYSYDSNSGLHRVDTSYIRPDVIIRSSEHDYEIELIEQKRYHFRLRYNHTEQASSYIADQTNRVEIQRYIHNQTDRAHNFIDSIRHRWHTLQHVTEFVVDYQREFLEKGVRYLRPLTRSTVASQLQLDEGTVSRAIANKYALLPNGRLVAIADFFKSSLSIKDVLRELITEEPPKRRFSDDDLARILTARGIPMARRTVTKYREEMGIPSSRERH